jgi:hypothetical protein
MHTRRVGFAVPLVAALVVAGAGPTLGQSPAPPLDPGLLEAVCRDNSQTDDDLEACLDVVHRILAPAAGPGPAATPASVLSFDPIRLAGRGDKVARFEKPDGEPSIADIRYSGQGNFAVWTIAADGSSNDLEVNVIGEYEGTVLFDAYDSESTVALRIEATGRWRVDIKPVALARRWQTTDELEGRGDDVVILEDGIEGFASTTIRHRGRSNFAVWAYTSEGADLLVNEIGRYEGEVLLPDGTLLLEVSADGPWSFSPPS